MGCPLPVPERNTTVYQGVGWLRTASNGRAFAVVGTSGFTSTTYRLLEIDLKTGATRYRSDVVEGASFVPGWGVPFSSALSPDAADVYFTIGDAGVARVRVRDNLIERIPNPIVAGRVYLAPDGRHLFTMTGLETASTKISVIEVR